MTLLDFFMVFFKKMKIITILTILFGGGALLYVLFFTTPIYKAECRLLPPAQRGSMATAMLAQMGGLAELAGISSGANGELLMGVLRGETVVSKVIEQFDLMNLYEQKYHLKMYELVNSDILETTQNARSGIVTVAVWDKDPIRAAEMTNAFVDELKNVMQSLAIGEAAQRRLFFEQQMLQARKTLDEAEDELSRYQEKSGLVAMEPQFEAMVSSIAVLRAQVAAKEVELSSLKTYANTSNPNLRRAESELIALQTALAKLEQEQRPSEGTTLVTSLREAPQMGLEYQRKLRNIKYATAMYDLMLKQFEAAKIDESRESIVVQIVDPATPPDYKSKPRRALIVLFATMFGFCLGIMWVLFTEYLESLKKNPEQRQILNELKSTFLFQTRC